MRDTRSGRYRLYGWAGLALCAIALLAVVIPGVGYARARADDGVRLDGRPQHVVLPADRTYGIYVNDANNSGYSESCSAIDSSGKKLRMEDPPWSVSSSDTEMLDLAFNTGSGDVTIDCDVPGERVTARPVPNDPAMFLGIIFASIVGSTGVGLLLVWVFARSSRKATTRTSTTLRATLGSVPAGPGTPRR